MRLACSFSVLAPPSMLRKERDRPLPTRTRNLLIFQEGQVKAGGCRSYSHPLRLLLLRVANVTFSETCAEQSCFAPS